MEDKMISCYAIYGILYEVGLLRGTELRGKKNSGHTLKKLWSRIGGEVKASEGWGFNKSHVWK